MKKITKVLAVFLAGLMAFSTAMFTVSAEDEECAHDYTSKIIETTCSQYGCTKFTCSLCGNVYEEDVVDALGHTYGKWIISQDETCDADGIKYRECSVCDTSEKGHIETGFVKATGHEYGEGVVTAPTCGSKGYTTYTCVTCGGTKTDSEVPALQHTYGEWTEVTAPTCTAQGSKERTCSICAETAEGHVETAAIPALGHDYQATVVEPTYTADGYTIHQCSRCEENYQTDPTDMLDGKVESVELGEKVVVNYEQVAQLSPVVTELGDVEYTVSYKSDAENVATVDANGNITGKGMGKTVITCTVVDEYGNVVTDTVDVQVKFTFANWMQIIREVIKAAIDIVLGGLDFGPIKDLIGKK